MASRTLKIAVVAEHVHRHGGQERVLAELITRLARCHRIDVFCFSAADIPTDHVRVHRLWCPFDSSTLQAIWLVLLSPWVIRRSRYDVILSQGGNSLIQNFVLVHTCHALRARALREIRWQYDRPSWLRRLGLTLRQAWATWMEGRAVRRCRGRVIAVSQMLADYLIAQHSLQPAEIFVVPNGLDHAVFNLQAREKFRPGTRQAHGISPEEFIILFAGGRWFDKGLPLVIEAVALMKEPGQLLIVGDGDQEVLEHLAEQYHVRERISFIPPTDQIVRYYAAADCLVLPARAEGFGLVAAEAAACGVPLVTTQIGVADQLVEDRVSGFLVGFDPAGIAQRLDVLARDVELRQRMGQAVHKKALKLSWDRQAERIERIFLDNVPESAAALSSIPAPTAATGQLRVAVISHSCVVNTNQELYARLMEYGDVSLRLIAPQHWWASVSGPIEFSALPSIADYAVPLPVWLPGQIHFHWYTQQLARVLDDFEPHIVYVDEEPYSLAAAQATYLSRRLGCKLIVTSKENLSRTLPVPFRWVYKWVLGHADHIVVVSSECEEVLRGHGYERAVTILVHGVDPAVFQPARQVPRPPDMPSAGPVVGYVGRLTPQKGVMDLVQAVQIAACNKGPAFHLLLIGDGPLRVQIKQIADHSSGSPQITVAGHISPHQMPGYMNTLDLLVLPSRTTPRWKEQFGRVLIEALACEVPVVGSDSGHIPHLIEDTGGGLVFPEGDVEKLTETIQGLLADPDTLQTLGRRGRQRVLERYTWRHTAEQLHQVLLRVVEE